VDKGRIEVESVSRDRAGKLLLTTSQKLDRRAKPSDLPEAPTDAALKRYLGTWTIQGESKPKGQEATPIKKVAYRIGGPIVHFDDPKQAGKGQSDFHMLVTVDRATKTYPAIMMFSQGRTRLRTTGTWDEAEQTMTFQRKFPHGNVSTIVHRFISPIQFEDHSKLTNVAGELLWEQSLSHTRKAAVGE
jgi:hypothetical protein